MVDFVQSLIDGIDKTTERGLTEALLIAISNVKNKDGLLVNEKLGSNYSEHMEYVEQVAKMLLHKEET
jgi:uncharacterized membrane protein YwaF